MKCPNKSYKFYQDLLKAIEAKYPTLDKEAIDDKALVIWYRTEQVAFTDWYGSGVKDAFGNPLLQADSYKNGKGEVLSVFDLRNDARFDEQEKVNGITENLDKETKEYAEVITKIKDALIQKEANLRSLGSKSVHGDIIEQHRKTIRELTERIGKVKAKEGMALFAKAAIDEINTAYNKLKDLESEGRITPANLRVFRNYVSGYDIIDEALYVLKKNNDEFTTVDKSAINEAIENRNYIKKFYIDKILPVIAEELSKHSVFSTKEQIEEYLKNAPFDINGREKWLDFIGDSRDAVLPLIAKVILNAKDTVRKEHIEFRHNLVKKAVALEKAKGNPANVEALFDEIIERDINGKKTGRYVSEFRMGEFDREKQKYADAMREIKDENSDEFKRAKETYYKWLRENTLQKYNSKYQEIFNSVSQEARDTRELFTGAKREIMDAYKTKAGTYDLTDITSVDWYKLKELERGLAQLKNLFDENGLEKSGKELRIAKELRAFSDKVSKVYERVATDYAGFEEAKKKATDMGEETLAKWKSRNIRMEFTDEFWKAFESLTSILANDEKKDINEKMNSLVAEYKDENGVVNGDIVPDNIKVKVRSLLYEKSIITKAQKGTFSKEQIRARMEMQKLVKFVPTAYYEKVVKEKEKLATVDFEDWVKKNHYITHTGEVMPLSVWTTMMPVSASHIKTEVPNNNWHITDVKSEYLNSNYREDEYGHGFPVDKWKNNQHTKLMNSGNKQLIDFYNFFVKNLGEANNLLPTGYRLGTRIPGIRKGLVSRIIDRGDQNAVDIIKESIKDKFQRRKDDTSYGQLLNENKDPIDYIPIYFTGDVEPEEMSYDLTNVLSAFYYMAMNHGELSKSIDLIEGSKELVRNRTFTDSSVINKLKGLSTDEIRKEGKTSNAIAQLEKYIKMVVYGQANDDLGFIDTKILGKIDTSKLLDKLNLYTSTNLLAGNVIAGTLNIFQGETNNWMEAAAGEFFGNRSYLFANREYNKNITGIAADVGARTPANKINLLNEWLDTLGKYETEVVNDQENNRFKRLMKGNMLFFMNNIGEHSMQSKVMIAMLREIVPLDASGGRIEGLNNMYDAYTIKEGKLVLDARVDNFGKEDQQRFTRKMQGVIRRLHGNYNAHTAAMWQSDARLRLVGAMRKWIRPGWLRRWEYKRNNEFLEVVTEGMYITTGRVVWQMMKDIKQMRFDLMKEDWDKLSPMEKQNIKRTALELVALLTAIVGSWVIYAAAGGDDKDKRENNKALLYFAYQAYRLRQELTFYVSPISAINIMRSPAASMSVFESSLKLVRQFVSDPSARYEKGSREGQLKFGKDLEDMIPMYKQVHRTFTSGGLEDQLNFLTMKQGIHKKKEEQQQ